MAPPAPPVKHGDPRSAGAARRSRSTALALCLAGLLLLPAGVMAAYLEVTLLGTGTPRPDAERFGPATVVEAGGRYFLFDAGRGATIRLRQAGIPLGRIEGVFLTHLHSDHLSGLDDLWLTGWIWQRPRPLEVHGPAGVKGVAAGLEGAYAADVAYRSGHTGLDAAAAAIAAREIGGEGVVYAADGVTITAFEVDHGPVKPAYGFRLEFHDRTVVISGDTTYSPNLVRHARGADLLVHEIAAADGALLDGNPRLRKVLGYHTTPQQLRRVIEEAAPRAAVLTHVLAFGPGAEQDIAALEADYPERLRVGEDLLRIGVGDTIRFTPSRGTGAAR